MGRLQQVNGAFALMVTVAIGGGCLPVRTDGKSALVKDPVVSETRVDPAVEQASAKVPAAVPSASMAALAKASATELPKGAATDIALAWQNKVAQLPDPTRNGAMIHGVVGQMFLFAADSKAAQANGTLTVEMLDQSPGVPEGKRLGKWTFEKDVLKKLITMDERFGKSYALFLPWPEYDPNVSRVKLLVRFDPEKSYPLYAAASTLTFDFGANGSPTHQRRQVTGVDAAGFGGLNSPPPSAPQPPPALNPFPVGGRNAPSLPAPTITPQR
jgi:hypothetical protein